MGLLTGYALIPCAASLTSERAVMAGENEEDVTYTKAVTKGVRLTVSNTLSAGKKQAHILSPGSGSTTFSISQALWGSKALEAVQEFHLELSFEAPKAKGRLSSSASSEDAKCVAHHRVLHPVVCLHIVQRHSDKSSRADFKVCLRVWAHEHRPTVLLCQRKAVLSQQGLFKYRDRDGFLSGAHRDGAQIQKAFNEVYRSFNTNQAPFVIADFHVPRGQCAISNVPTAP